MAADPTLPSRRPPFSQTRRRYAALGLVTCQNPEKGQTIQFRPVARAAPQATPQPGMYQIPVGTAPGGNNYAVRNYATVWGSLGGWGPRGEGGRMLFAVAGGVDTVGATLILTGGGGGVKK